jgi:Tol biopolymer transport system component
MISIIGSSLKKLRDDATDAALSPDGSQIVFTDEDRTSVWVMAADGSQARPVIKADPEVKFYAPTWFTNGKRLFYAKVPTANNGLVLESRNLQGGDPVVCSRTKKLPISRGISPDAWFMPRVSRRPTSMTRIFGSCVTT